MHVLAQTTPAPTTTSPLTTQLCVTRGALTSTAAGKLATSDAVVRAVTTLRADRAVLRFRYLGPTTPSIALGSGRMRRQVGLKLRAQDGCNVIYVMWRIEPESRVVVSLKRNPGMTVHAQCRNGGYENFASRLHANVAAVNAGEDHTLTASLQGSTLTVEADRQVVWQGDLPAEALALDGPVGMRSDNVNLEFELQASSQGKSYRSVVDPAACRRAGPED